MSDLTYRVLIDIGMKGDTVGSLSNAHRKAIDVDSALRRVGDAARSVGSQLAGAFTGAVEAAGEFTLKMGVLAGAAGIGAVTYGVVKLNAEIESAKIGIGATLNAFGAAPTMAAGLGMAADQVEKMRKDAAALPGEFSDLKQFFSLGLSPGLQSGASVDKLRSMAANAMATSAALQVPMDMAAREYGQLLSGRAGAHNILGSKLGITGGEAEKFNAATPAARLDMLSKSLERFAPAIEAYKTSFEGLSSSFVDNAKNFLRIATEPLFNRVKSTLGDMNAWIDNNQGTWEGWAHKIGRDLAHMFDLAKEKALEWAPVIATFAENAWDRMRAFWMEIEPIVSRIADKIENMMLDPKTFDRIGDTLKMYAGVKLGGPVVSALGQGLGAVSGEGGMAASLGLGAVSMGEAALVALPAMLALAGIMHTLADETSRYHDYEVKEFERASAAADDLAQKVGTDGLMGALDALGAGAIAWADMIINYTPNIYTAVKLIADAASYLSMGDAKLNASSDDAWKESGTQRPGYELGSHGGYAIGQAARETDAMAAAKKMVVPAITQHFKVELIVTQNQDPMRVAELVMDSMHKISRHPTQAARNFTK